ncbi:MAG: hypothetical protein KF734_12070 [Saprospiraceae bacterium]|nr:hypothetical protein [Saprospiraceae bacterium]
MTKRSSFFIFFSALAALLFTIACNAPAAEKPAPAPAANSDVALAPAEYADLSKKALEHLTKFEFDAWGTMLADTVQYNFPNGDEQTRTKLTGKQAVLDWWKNWQQTSGIQSMTTDRLNQYSLEVSKSQLPGGLTGVFSYAYFSNKMVFNGTPVSVRMNFIAHFNKDKKIDRYFTYYDRQPIIEAMGGKNLLKEVPATK